MHGHSQSIVLLGRPRRSRCLRLQIRHFAINSGRGRRLAGQLVNDQREPCAEPEYAVSAFSLQL